MRTEDDLRTAFDQLADSAPHPDSVLADLRPERSTPRRRTPIILVSAVATVAVAVGGPLAIAHLRSDSQAAGQEGLPMLQNWVTVPIPAGMVDRGHTYQQDYQVQYLLKATGPVGASCLWSVHRNGSFDASSIPAGSPTVTINGIKASVVTAPTAKPVLKLPPEYYAGNKIVSKAASGTAGPIKLVGKKMTTVAWQPAAGLWALVTCERQVDNGWLDAPYNPDVANAMALAKTITGQSARLSSPVQVSYLPEGLAPARTYTSDAEKFGPKAAVPEAGNGFDIHFSDGNLATGVKKDSLPSIARDGQPEPGDDLAIAYQSTKEFLQSYRQRKPDLTINGLPAWYGVADQGLIGKSKGNDPRTGLTIVGKHYDFAVTVVGFHNGSATVAEVRKIAEGLHFAPSPTDKSTWFDAAVAIPAPR
ncbi:hypothetical protein GCM10009789_40300 [Kribbella sancticallisti]|uniref:Uncharacterized protein n=1 Tax=Kribbella sancticallisti TaxID=460087 RepID=A0ABN2DRN2_9ACTN